MIRIRRVLAPNPGIFTLEGTNTWIVGTDPAVVIDPGPDHEGHLHEVAAQAGAVVAILVTHDHPDHSPGAEGLSRLTGALVHANLAAPGRVRLRDGDRIATGGGDLRAVHTPGHTSDHMVFLLESERAMFTGDTVLGRGTTVIDPPDGNLSDYIRSLDRLRELDPRVIYPGHGPTVFEAGSRLEEYMAHRRMREDQVMAAIQRGHRTPAEIVAAVYTDVPPAVHPLAERQVRAQLTKLQREGRVRRAGPADAPRYELVPKPARACVRCGRPAAAGSVLCRTCSVDALQEKPPG